MINCKAIWAATLGVRLAEEVLERALAVLYQRCYDLARITVIFHKSENFLICEETSIRCFSLVDSDPSIYPKDPLPMAPCTDIHIADVSSDAATHFVQSDSDN